ncbi:RDD family protein [Actinomadura scrupuli]|uniref:RDD family protein n=1 Tax=Actinomadura scrupuli TaxID=559629 RepID=UPI003D9705EE
MSEPKQQQTRRGGPAGSWLGGVRSAGVDLGFPGERLGLPEEGPGSAASYGRRLLALFIDWGLAWLAVLFLARVLGWHVGQGSLLPVAVFAVEVWLLTGLLGLTAGKRLLGLRVVRLDGRPVGLLWSLVRTLLLVLVIPALVWDRDYRGLHDRAADTVVINV